MPRQIRECLILCAIALAALCIHGYHLGGDDSAIYIPAIKKAANPALFPDRTEFFMSHASMSIFPDVVGGLARILHVPADWAIFLFYIASLFLLLVAARRLACICFTRERARWGAVGLLAGVLTLPVAGTALFIMDPNVTARSLSTPLLLFAVAFSLQNRWRAAIPVLLFTAFIHPHMSAFGVAFMGCLALMRYWAERPLTDAVAVPTTAFALTPLVFELMPAHGTYLEILRSRSYFFLASWEWWEWVGAIAPLAILWCFAHFGVRGSLAPLELLCRSAVGFGVLFTGGAMVLGTSDRFQNLARLQPMRSFHMIYVIFIVLLGGVLGEYALRRSAMRWILFFTALGLGMGYVQWSSFRNSPHVEWPGVSYRSAWMQAFLWIRGNTPPDAFFALDPNYFEMDGEDQHGFRAVSERNALADNLKDSGAVSVFPQLGRLWKSEVLAQEGWGHFQWADFQRLGAKERVTWVVVKRPAAAGLRCPYANAELEVCSIR